MDYQIRSCRKHGCFWFDLATGGQLIGDGSPLESIGTSVMPDASNEGDYSFL